MERLREVGKRVPEDVAVCGYDDIRTPTLSQPLPTTYRVNLDQMAKIAVWSIQQQLQQGRAEPVLLTVPGQLIIISELKARK